MNLKIPGVVVLTDDQTANADFKTDGEKAWCIHCGVIKEASAKFFVEHYWECVEPRKREKDEVRPEDV